MAAKSQLEERDSNIPESIKTQNFTEEEMRQEMDNFLRIINAFLYYKEDSYRRVDKMEGDYLQLSASHKQLLPHYLTHLDAVRRAVDTNYKFISNIVASGSEIFKNSGMSISNPAEMYSCKQAASGFDMEKVVTTIKQFFRDWSKKGQQERDVCYKPILEEIKEIFPSSSIHPSQVSILVPGSGLGRLAWEIAKLGYCCQGNEFSMYMLLSSNYILNNSLPVESVTLHPWVLRSSNNLTYKDQLDDIKIPDVDTSELSAYGLFSMAAGDFLEVYTTKDEWDCVVTCFFMDTAHNVITYLEKIHHILKPGGHWINLGPLLYHFADMGRELSIELAYEDIRTIAEKQFGFSFLKELTSVNCCYLTDPNCMMQTFYKCVFSVAKKPL